MLTKPLTSETVGQLVRQCINRARVFETFGIDYCCHGHRSLSDACTEAGVDLDEVRRRLEECDAGEKHPDDVDWSTAPLGDLVDHIVERHHVYLREELPLLDKLIAQVVSVHGRIHPQLLELCEVFSALNNELHMHMMKEEQVLFPIIKQLERAKAEDLCAPQFHCGSVNNPIAAMEHEHAGAGDALVRMRSLTSEFEPPPDACATFQAVMARLAELEADLHLHIHKENNILFPRASELEAQLTGGTPLPLL